MEVPEGRLKMQATSCNVARSKFRSTILLRIVQGLRLETDLGRVFVHAASFSSGT